MGWWPAGEIKIHKWKPGAVPIKEDIWWVAHLETQIWWAVEWDITPIVATLIITHTIIKMIIQATITTVIHINLVAFHMTTISVIDVSSQAILLQIAQKMMIKNMTRADIKEFLKDRDSEQLLWINMSLWNIWIKPWNHWLKMFTCMLKMISHH